MTEAIETTRPSPIQSRAGRAFETPKFEFPNFEIPKMEIPAAFRELAEKSVSQAKETYEKMKSAAEEATDVLEDTYATATKGAADYGLKMIEAARENTNAAFDFATQLMTVKSLSEMVELSTAHTRKQFETLHRSIQGTGGDRAESGHRVRRAGEGKLGQGFQEDRLIFAASARRRCSYRGPGPPPGLYCGLNAAAPCSEPSARRCPALVKAGQCS